MHILAHIDFLEESIADCEAQIETLCRPFAEVIGLLDTIPGISQRTAQDLVAALGVEMAWFPAYTASAPRKPCWAASSSACWPSTMSTGTTVTFGNWPNAVAKA
jgi:hypothetical protein